MTDRETLRGQAYNAYVGAALKGIDTATWPSGEPMVDIALMHRTKVAQEAADAVLGAAWLQAQNLYGTREGMEHDTCGDGNCNACILDDIAGILGRRKSEESK